MAFPPGSSGHRWSWMAPEGTVTEANVEVQEIKQATFLTQWRLQAEIMPKAGVPFLMRKGRQGEGRSPRQAWESGAQAGGGW